LLQSPIRTLKPSLPSDFNGNKSNANVGKQH
jgi:hypothetical protein